MDLLSIAGLAVALAGIVLGQLAEGGSPASLAQGAALLIVLGGTFGATMLQHRLPVFLAGMRMAAWVVAPPRARSRELIGLLAQWSAIARKDGTLALERRLEEVDDPFVRSGLQLLIDGLEPDKIRAALEVEIEGFADRLAAAARVWEAAGGYAPTIGIIGAVLGLIHVMENLTDPSKLGGGIATAFVATVYGVGLANLVFLPIAGKLRALGDDLVRERELFVDGLTAIAVGENPRLIATRLEGYVS
jgi:chemotaxis protein MotA